MNNTKQRSRVLYEIVDDYGTRVHSTRNRQDAYRICAKFDQADRCKHSVRLCQTRAERSLL